MVHLSPFEENQLGRECFFSSFTVALIALCAVFSPDETSSDRRLFAEKTFIYTFIGMMGLMVLLLIKDSLSGCFTKCKKGDKKKISKKEEKKLEMEA